MMRYKDLLNKQLVDGRKIIVYTKHISDGDSEVAEIQDFIQTFKIDLVMGINIYRVGLVLTKLSCKPNIITVAGGTDVNHFIEEEKKKAFIL